MEALHRTFTNKIFILKTYPNAYADANSAIASLASAAIEATPMATPMAAVMTRFNVFGLA